MYPLKSKNVPQFGNLWSRWTCKTTKYGYKEQPEKRYKRNYSKIRLFLQ